MKWRKPKRTLKIWRMTILMAVWLSGCSQSQPEPQPPQWTVEAECCAVMEGVEISGTLSHTLEGISSFTVTAPDEMSGMLVQYRSGTYTVSFQGLTQPEMGSVMDESIFGRLFAALDGGAQADMEWGNQQWSGTLSGGEGITVKTDNTGEIRDLQVPVWQLSVSFMQQEMSNIP